MIKSDKTKLFNISNFCHQIILQESISTINLINREVSFAEGIQVNEKDSTIAKLEYIKKLKQFAFILGTGDIPVGIQKDSITLFKTVIVKLVDKGNLDSSLLRVFQ